MLASPPLAQLRVIQQQQNASFGCPLDIKTFYNIEMKIFWGGEFI
jgi:hypothetical protein